MEQNSKLLIYAPKESILFKKRFQIVFPIRKRYNINERMTDDIFQNFQIITIKQKQ